MKVQKLTPLNLVATNDLLKEIGSRFDSFIMVFRINNTVDSVWEGQPIDLLGLINYGKIEINELIRRSISDIGGTEETPGT